MALAMTLAASALGAVKVPAVFGDNMVLQRDKPVPVWGSAAPGEQVTVTFAGQSRTATAANDGRWRVDLAPLTTSKIPAELVIKGENELRFTNVLVGEVWLCSGQSNMEWTMLKSNDSAREIAASAHPLLRLLHVKKTWDNTPRNDVELTAAWAESSPASTPNFSAVAYYFGRELLNAFNNEVPVGLINSSWGGTRIEPWTSPAGFAGNPALKQIHERIEAVLPGSGPNKQLTTKVLADYDDWLARARNAAASGGLIPVPPEFPAALRPLGEGKSPYQQPTMIYNAMIAPLVPCAFRGVIWYQGEANRTDGMLYYEKMKALIKSWRAEFENPDMPLYFVQLAPYTYPKADPFTLPEIWQAQQRFAREDPHSGMAVINDIGNIENIHPTNKQVVGKRLSLHALNKTYGRADIACESPVPTNVRFAKGEVVITFGNAQKLTTRDGAAPDNFEVAGTDGAYMEARAKISGNTVTVRSDAVARPLAVRFAWKQTAEPNLRNEAGLQAGAFAFDGIPYRAELDQAVPEAAAFKIAYVVDPLTTTGDEVSYTVNNTASLSGAIKRVAYFLQTVAPNGAISYAFASMDPFTTDLGKIGVPTKNSGARFQQYVQNLEVKSNVPGVKTGSFKRGNIEFWDCNYSARNDARIPGASDDKHDFGDAMSTTVSPGYGSMQIHNTAEKQTIIAYNKWRAGKDCDIGIGNQPSANPDWTFSSSGKNLRSARLIILVEME